MGNQEQIQHWLSEFNSRYGHHFELNEGGLCGFSGADGIEYTLEVPEGSGIIYFHAALRSVPQDDRTKLKLYEKLLEINLFGEQMQGGSLAVDPKDNMVILWFRYGIDDLDFQRFENAISVLVEAGRSFETLFMDEPPESDKKQPAFSDFDMLQFRV